MAYDEGLAERIRSELVGHPSITETKLFGGIAFMLSGNMAVGVSGDELMVRIDPEEQDALLAEAGVRVFDMTGRPMKGWILVAPTAIEEDQDLEQWLHTGLSFAGSLPAK